MIVNDIIITTIVIVVSLWCSINYIYLVKDNFIKTIIETNDVNFFIKCSSWEKR